MNKLWSQKGKPAKRSSGSSAPKELPAHPEDHDHPVPWAELMGLEKITDDTYRSTCRAFEPAAGLEGAPKQAFGGHVYAQAVWAAAQTVPKELICHSVTGFFTLHASSELPFVFAIRRVRDGRSFCVRTVEVTQVETKGICFTATMSFKTTEPSDIEFQREMKFEEHYAEALHGQTPEQLPRASGTEHPMMVSYGLDFYGPPFPGLVSKKVDMEAYNEGRHPLAKRAINYFQVIGDMPPYSEAPNLHVAAYLYASDRNSLFSVSRHLGVADNYGKMASLSLSVTIHVTDDELSLVDGEGKPRWFSQEAWTDRMADGRGVHYSRLWTAGGSHAATSVQDGLIRLSFWPEEEKLRKREELKQMMIKGKL